MPVSRNRLAGLGLGAVGLAALASPASAQQFTWGISNTPPEYAAQAIKDVIAGTPPFLLLPSGLDWISDDFPVGSYAAGNVVIQFTPPTGDTWDCSAFVGTPTPTGIITTATMTSCSASAFTVDIAWPHGTAVASPPTRGDVTLPQLAVQGAGLATLAALAPASSPNCAGNFTALCSITATVLTGTNLNLAVQTYTLLDIMATSADDYTSIVTSSNGQSCIDIDIFSYHSNGQAFQQPCSHDPGHSGPLADKGNITITENGLLGPGGLLPFVFSDTHGQVTVTGACGGNVQVDVGSTAASCGILPLTGETIYLIPTNASGTATAYTNCTDTTPTTPSAIDGAITAPSATFSVLWPNPATSSVWEVCDYSNGDDPPGAVIGDVASWATSASIDCVPTVLPDCTTHTDGANALLGYHYNGEISYFNFTIGNPLTAFQAFLRVVDRNPATPTNLGANGEEVVCLVTGDDGTNGYASLYTNTLNNGITTSNGNSDATGLPAGQNAFFPIQTVFSLAGVGGSATNPFILGSLVCFHDSKLYLRQVWEEPNGTIVNMQ